MKMNCIIVEDQLPAQRILKKYIADVGTLHLLGSYTNALEALSALKEHKVDVIFLDIHLPKISGMDFLKNLANPPQIIFTTAFQDYALESYEYNVVDYLLKPFSFQRFVKAVSKLKLVRANEKNSGKENETILNDIYIKSGYDYVKIKIDELIYILSDSDYTELHATDKKYLSSESLRYWEKELPEAIYTRVHKSYIINT